MMQLEVAHMVGVPVEARAADLLDLSATPWRRIFLSRREPIWCLVDAADHAWLSENTWNLWHAGRGGGAEWQKYAKRNVGRDRATVRMHREILIKACPPPDEAFLAKHVVHHHNGQTLDNRRANLAWVTRPQNNHPAARRPRGQAPSLDQIVRELVAGLGAGARTEEIPF